MEITAEQSFLLAKSALETFKLQWPQEVKWDYRIDEINNIHGTGVQIFVSVRGHEIILYSRTYFSGPNSPPIAHAWRRIITDMMTCGLSATYIETVRLHRGRGFIINSVPPEIANSFPLTFAEAMK